jgi:hypothetical protein
MKKNRVEAGEKNRLSGTFQRDLFVFIAYCNNRKKKYMSLHKI